MTQHYLLSSAARTFSSIDIAALSEERAFKLFKSFRWGNPDNLNDVCCPYCNIHHCAYFNTTRQRWKCKYCKREFYTTTNTAFAFHKLTYKQILYAIALFVNDVRGCTALSLARNLNVQYKTAFVLLHKIREVLFKTRDLSQMSGEIHEDGCWNNFTVRKKNFRKPFNNNTKTKRCFPKFRLTKSCLLTLNQVSHNPAMRGSNRTLVALGKAESADIVLPLNYRFVKAGSTIFCDENSAYANLNAHYHLWRVNHQEAYSKYGVSNNFAESFNARWRALHRGLLHKCDNKYLLHYANEVAWRSDNRRKSNGEQFQELMQRCLQTPTLKEWNGYWQGNHREKPLWGMRAFALTEICENYANWLKEHEELPQDEFLKLIA